MGDMRHRATDRTHEATQPAPAPAAEPAAGDLALQRTAGNAAVGLLIADAQAKLEVGAVDDPLETEADRVAAEVVRSVRTGAVGATPPTPSVQRGPSPSGGAAGDDGGRLPGDTEQALRAASRGGGPLPATVQRQAESAFGQGFSDVRVHSGPDASALNDAVGAKAFTVGSDIFFRDQVPQTTDHLVAHELTHVVQQRGGSDAVARRAPAAPGSASAPTAPSTPSAPSAPSTPSAPADSGWSKRQSGTSSDTKTERSSRGSETTTTERKAMAGVGSELDESTDTFDGTTRTQTEAKGETLAGAEAAVKTIVKASPGEIEAAVEAMARAGLFGETSRKTMVQRGALSAGAEGAAKGSLGAEVGGKASAKVSADLFNALAVVAEAGAKVGAEGSLEGRLHAGLGPLAGSIGGQLKVFAGAMAKAKGTLSVGITHVHAEGEASAFAGAQTDATVDVKLKIGDAEATAALEGTAMAGAQAKAKGAFKIDLTGIEASGKAEAHAGVKAEASAKGSVTHQGRTVFAAKGTVGVQAGIGGEAGGEFMFRGGKLTIKGDLAGTLGIGTKVGAELEVDFYALALMIEDLIVQAFLAKKEEINRASPKVERVPIIDPDLAAAKRKAGYDAYYNDFAAYDKKKAKQGNSGIKRERVQEILDKRWSANKDNWQYLEFDEGVTQAAKDAFGSKLKDIGIQAGQLRWFEVERTAAQKEHLAKERRKAGLKF